MLRRAPRTFGKIVGESGETEHGEISDKAPSKPDLPGSRIRELWRRPLQGIPDAHVLDCVGGGDSQYQDTKKYENGDHRCGPRGEEAACGDEEKSEREGRNDVSSDHSCR